MVLVVQRAMESETAQQRAEEAARVEAEVLKAVRALDAAEENQRALAARITAQNEEVRVRCWFFIWTFL
jgi:hypothetical protein